MTALPPVSPQPLPPFQPGTTSVPPLSKVYVCRRDPSCRSSFTTPFALKRHERSSHPTPEDQSLCPTCNAQIVKGKFEGHVSECAQGRLIKKQRTESSPAPVLPLDLDLVDAALEGFMDWLATPASTLYSQKVKKSLPKPEQSGRVRSDLRNLARVCYELSPSTFTTGFFLGGLVTRQVVDALHAYHTSGRQRQGGQDGAPGVGHDVRYRLNLLLVKVIVYLSETSPVPVPPTAYESWVLVHGAAHHASKQRRLDLRTKHLLNQDEPLPTTDEIVQLLRWTIAKMDELRRLDYQRALDLKSRVMYTNSLMVASFVLFNGPRQQVFRAMTTSTVVAPNTDTNPSDHYLVRIPGDQLKNQRPELISVSDRLTTYYRFYVERVLPAEYEGPLWRTEQGKPRADFGPPVRQLVAAIIGKRVGPHKLRAAVATHWARSSMSDTERRGLAQVMDHSVMVADTVYVEQRGRVEVQHRLAEQWMELAGC